MGEGGNDGAGGLDGGDIDGVRTRLRITPGAALGPTRGVSRDVVDRFVCILLGEVGALRLGGGGGGLGGCLDADD